MPSRAEARVWLENALRGIVVSVLGVMLWQSLRSSTDSLSGAIRVRGIDGGSLAKWSVLASAPSRIRVQLAGMPSSVERAWLGALAGAGSSVMWSGDLTPVMIDAQPVASPTGATNVVVAAPNGTSLVVSDDVGPVDTIRVQNAGAALTLNSSADHVTARVKGAAAFTVLRDSIVLHKVLVIGDADWESKFVVAALEEEGWKVDAFIRLAPGVDVTQGSAATIDTSRYSAVVALDSAALPYANRIIEFARMGGGVVLAPSAASLNPMVALRAGGIGRPASQARAIQANGSVSLATLALASITSLRSDAVSLDARAGTVAIAARRVGAGRALQLGYEDTWRWRMGGAEGAVRDHRLWWTGLVSSVAYAPRVPRATTDTTSDEAPMAALVTAIGPGSPASTFATLSETSSNWVAWLFALLTLGLIVEVASRRMRGAS